MTSLFSGTTEAESNYSEICVVGRDLTEFNAIRYGSFIRRIDLSFNLLMKVHGLEGCAPVLEELVLDNNQLIRLELRAQYPKLHTLSLNKNRDEWHRTRIRLRRIHATTCYDRRLYNMLKIWKVFIKYKFDVNLGIDRKISNLTPLLKELTSRTPNLRYLSLLGNPVCPDQLSDEKAQESEYASFRCHILFHLPKLRFLDHRIVSSIELAESQKLGYQQMKISPYCTPLPASASTLPKIRTSSSLSENNSDPATAPTQDGVEPLRKKGRQGRRKFKYVGKNSEGNRFIKDSDL